MKNHGVQQGRQPGKIGFSQRLWLIFLILILAVPLTLPGHAAPGQGYDSLRLFTEALFEISQKYVWPKTEEEMIYGALRGMMNSLDPDSSFLTAKEYQTYLHGQKGSVAEAGLELVIKDNLLTAISVLDGGPAAKAGLKAGDHILKMDGHLVRNLTTQEATRRFIGPTGTSIKLHVMRNGQVKPLELTVVLEPLASGTVTTTYLEDVAYVRVRFFNDQTAREFAGAMKALKTHQPPVRGVILDLRNNARGTLEQAVQTAGVLLGDREIVLTKGRSPKEQEALRGKERDQVIKSPPPTVVLVDQGTARAAEAMAGALREQFPAKLLGSKTFGLCGLTRVLPLQDGSALVMTVAQCYTPRGHKIQGKGLEPEVAGKTPPAPKLTPKGAPETVTPEQDPWVQQALELLKPKKAQAASKKLG